MIDDPEGEEYRTKSMDGSFLSFTTIVRVDLLC